MRPRYGHFNWIAPFYDYVFGIMHHNGLYARLGARPDDVVLDIGGGTGRVATALTAAGSCVVVVDPSTPMLKKARSKGLPAVRAIAEHLPFRTQGVDRIFIVDAFHHFADHDLAAGELTRVLKVGGRMVIEEPDIRNPAVKLLALGERLALMQSKFYGPRDMRRLFAAHGAVPRALARQNISVQIVLEK